MRGRQPRGTSAPGTRLTTRAAASGPNIVSGKTSGHGAVPAATAQPVCAPAQSQHAQSMANARATKSATLPRDTLPDILSSMREPPITSSQRRDGNADSSASAAGPLRPEAGVTHG